jgi:mono/diheme cytochrome c family protein
LVIGLLALFLTPIGTASSSAADVPPELLFARQCSSCHTIGKAI